MQKHKRLVAVGCSHGIHIDWSSANRVLKFIASYKPDTVIHLGDALDTECFRRGAGPDDSDSAKSPSDDIAAGFKFMEMLWMAWPRATQRHYILGNHEDRLWNYAKSPNAMKAFAAQTGINEIQDMCKQNKVQLHKWTGNEQGVMVGNTRFMHGVLFNENYLRDTAEAFAPHKGNVVVAHAHRPGVAFGRRFDNPVAYGVGTLSDIPNMEYAKARRSTLSWGQSVVFGEYTDQWTQIWTTERQRDGQWCFPL